MLRYRTITSPDINNGLGCRMTIWVSGCNHQCPGCHNHELWDYNAGNPLFDTKVMDKICNGLIEKPYIKGITLSGGDPLHQSDENLIELKKFIDYIYTIVYSKRKFDIWVYSGDTYENLIKNKLIKNVLEKCDVLVDGPFKIDLRDITLPFRGSSNQRIIDLKSTMSNKHGKIIELDVK